MTDTSTYPASVQCSFQTEHGSISIAPWTGPEGGYALWHRGEVVWKSADANAAFSSGAEAMRRLFLSASRKALLASGLDRHAAIIADDAVTAAIRALILPSPPTTERQG